MAGAYPDMLARRFLEQAAPLNITARRLLLEEMLSVQESYIKALGIILEEEHNDSGRGVERPRSGGS